MFLIQDRYGHCVVRVLQTYAHPHRIVVKFVLHYSGKCRTGINITESHAVYVKYQYRDASNCFLRQCKSLEYIEFNLGDRCFMNLLNPARRVPYQKTLIDLFTTEHALSS